MPPATPVTQGMIMWNDLLSSPRASLIIFGLSVLPVLVAIWGVPWFVTQDGPAHMYNAHILVELLKANSSFAEFYTARLEPIPNLAGHLLSMGLMSVLSARTADRMMMTITFVGFTSSIVWLRWRVAGWRGMALVVPLAVILALNWMWLLGFYNFLLGACLFPVTLGFWWAERERMGLGQALILAGLLIFGYFCHLISLGLTAAGLVVLALATPGPGWRRRLFWTAVGVAPLIPLGVMYRALMQAGGEARPNWVISPTSWSLRTWLSHLITSDPLRLSRIRTFPFVEWQSFWFNLVSPTSLFVAAVVLFVAATIFSQRQRGEPGAKTYRAWLILAFLFFVIYYLGPSDFGAQHGLLLRERIILLGLVCLVPVLNLDLRRWSVRLGAAALVAAAAVQIASVWDYALTSNRVVSNFMEAQPHAGTRQRIKTFLVIDYRDPGLYNRFRVDPLLNIENMLGIGTSNIIWNNYEVINYYFPVKYRHDSDRAHARKTFEVRRLVFPDLSDEVNDERLAKWAQILPATHDQIDVLVVWGADPRADAINAPWFGTEPIFQRGHVRVFRHR